MSDEQHKKVILLRNEYLDKLKSYIKENTILIDCHSFSNNIPDAPDICIGYNNDESYSGLIINELTRSFEDSGYSIKYNFPYTNSLYPKMPFVYKSVMIEVNKRIYMDEDTITLNTNPRQWMRWYGCLSKIYNNLKTLQL